MKLAIVWAQYGPYHFARMSALRRLAGTATVHAVEIANQTSVYAWKRSAATDELNTLCPGSVFETLSFWKVFLRARRIFSELNLDACLLPGYALKAIAGGLTGGKIFGNSHRHDERKPRGHFTRGSGWENRAAKRQLMALFDSALVGGNPQKRYAVSFGVPPEKIFTGYDAVDNDYFSTHADNAQGTVSGRVPGAVRFAGTLLSQSWTLCRQEESGQSHPCLSNGAGCESHEPDAFGHGRFWRRGCRTLRKLCDKLRLPVYDKKKTCGRNENRTRPSTEPPGVHFYGFRQIDDNPVFYALADAFVLPSLWEEWGLVVNEAMASGLPVVVSETAGTARKICWCRAVCPPRPVFLEAQRESLAHLAGRIRQNGFVFNPHSVQTLAHALSLLESSPQLRQKMGQASRVAVEKFSCANFARNALAAIEAATGNPSAVCLAEDEGMLASKVNSMRHLHFTQALEPLNGGGMGLSTVALHRQFLEMDVESTLCSTYRDAPQKTG